MLSRDKSKLVVDLDELEKEKERLARFLRSKLKVYVTSSGGKLLVSSNSSRELKRIVNKFVYQRNLMNKYWVALESGVIKIKRFERPEKKEKRKRKRAPPSIISHGW